MCTLLISLKIRYVFIQELDWNFRMLWTKETAPAWKSNNTDLSESLWTLYVGIVRMCNIRMHCLSKSHKTGPQIWWKLIKQPAILSSGLLWSERFIQLPKGNVKDSWTQSETMLTQKRSGITMHIGQVPSLYLSHTSAMQEYLSFSHWLLWPVCSLLNSVSRGIYNGATVTTSSMSAIAIW